MSSSEQTKHVMVSYAPSYRRIAMTVAAALREKKCAVYLIANNKSVNEAMALGVENAALFVPLVCKDYQTHRGSSKEFNYADQLKLPMRPVLVEKGFVAKSWLGAALARHTVSLAPLEAFSSSAVSAIVDKLLESILKLFPGAIQPDYKPPTVKASLYPGGVVKGWYKQPDGVKGDMVLDHFTMCGERIRAQGTDQVGSFTCAGTYNTKTRAIEFMKQYIGAHMLTYVGTYKGHEGEDIVLTGTWNVVPADKTWSGPFRFDLLIKDVGDTEIVRTGNDVVILYHSDQKEVAAVMAEQLRDRGATVHQCTNGKPVSDEILKTTAIAVPIMSASFQASMECQTMTETCDDVGVEFVPAMAQKKWWQSGWLGVIMSGMLWTAFMDGKSMANIEQLCNELQGKRDTVFGIINANLYDDQSGAMTGWYESNGKKDEMHIEEFKINGGRISGSGSDGIGKFEINGSHGNDCRVEFRKQYIGKHFVDYYGQLGLQDQLVCISGEWQLKDYRGRFSLLMATNDTSGDRHVMLSYQWNHQGIVKKLHDLLKAKGVPLWFDIAGDMKGNINTAMADGVENAAIICCIATPDYNKSPNCAKELNYATQLGTDIVVCKVDKNFSPETWLKSCIQNQKTSELDIENVPKSADVIFKRIFEIWNYEEEHKKQTQSPKDIMYDGGECTGYYIDGDYKDEMVFSYFVMKNGRVRGQGDDPVGAFTICGTYDAKKMTMAFDKQYIGQHLVKYNGKLKGSPGKKLVIDGKWTIPGDEFHYAKDGPFQLTCAH